MLDTTRIVVVTPAGRRRYLEILFRYILKLRPIMDEYRLWVNTENNEDIEYMREFQKQHSDFVTLEYLPDGVKVSNSNTIKYFFKNCCDENTIFVRIDDDIVYIETNQFKDFLEFRKKNPEYFLVFANIVNNVICTHLHQRIGAISTNFGNCDYYCFNNFGWINGDFARFIHYNFHEKYINKNVNHYKMNNWLLNYKERVSVNLISWLGEDLQKINGEVDEQEEEFLTVIKPIQDKRNNIIYGNFICVHYAYCTQREDVDSDPNIITNYNWLSQIN